MGRHNPCFSPLSLYYPETPNPIACLLHWLSWPGKRTAGAPQRNEPDILNMSVWLGWWWKPGVGAMSLSYLGWSWRKLFCFSHVECRRWVTEWQEELLLLLWDLYWEWPCSHPTAGLWKNWINSPFCLGPWILFLNFPPVSVFTAPALPLGNKYKLASSHSLTNCHSTFHAHGSVSGICPLEVSLHCWVFFLWKSEPPWK